MDEDLQICTVRNTENEGFNVQSALESHDHDIIYCSVLYQEKITYQVAISEATISKLIKKYTAPDLVWFDPSEVRHRDKYRILLPSESSKLQMLSPENLSVASRSRAPCYWLAFSHGCSHVLCPDFEVSLHVGLRSWRRWNHHRRQLSPLIQPCL